MNLYEVEIRHGYIESCSMTQLVLWHLSEEEKTALEIANSFRDSLTEALDDAFGLSKKIELKCCVKYSEDKDFNYCPTCGRDFELTSNNYNQLRQDVYSIYMDKIWSGDCDSFPIHPDECEIMEDAGWNWWSHFIVGSDIPKSPTHRVYLGNFNEWMERCNDTYSEEEFARIYFEEPVKVKESGE
jgi:hypothetical protein